jgi:hypothetical protein
LRINVKVPSIESNFTTLEQAVLGAICEMHLVDRAALEAQLSTATVLSRENTGSGFYTRFAVECASGAAIGGERLRHGPVARIDGLEHGMGFILWLKNGYEDCLEGYSFGESTSWIALERAGFEILHGRSEAAPSSPQASEPSDRRPAD